MDDPAYGARLAWAWVADGILPPAGSLPAGFRRAFRPGEDGLRPEAEAVVHRLTPVARFRELPPRQRPAAYCPSCLQRVVLKLGRVVRAHFAHRPRSVCGAARGEGALHLDAKLHLAAVLAETPGQPIRFRRRCAGVDGERDTRCARSPVTELGIEWDSVAVEAGLGELRPDVTLLRGGVPVLGLEVRATHAVSPATADAYTRLGMTWLEVPAEGVLPGAGLAWTPDEALDVLADAELYPGRWRCPVCGPRQVAVEAMRRDGASPFAWRRVTLYLRDAGRSGGERRVDSMDVAAVEQRRDGAPVEVWLERGDTRRRLAGPVPIDQPEQALPAAHHLFRRWAGWMRRERSAEVESPAHWSDARPRGKHPERLRWDSHAGAFRPVPNLPSLAWPFRPGIADGWTAPHPVLGWARCAWSETHPRHGVRTHAVAGPWWLTLAEHHWREEEADRTRADVSVWQHARGRWRLLGQASHTGSRRDWSPLLAGLAEAVDAADEVDGVVVYRLLAGLAGDEGRA